MQHAVADVHTHGIICSMCTHPFLYNDQVMPYWSRACVGLCLRSDGAQSKKQVGAAFASEGFEVVCHSMIHDQSYT